MKITSTQINNIVKNIIKENSITNNNNNNNNMDEKKQKIFKYIMSIIDRYVSFPDNNNQKLLIDNYKKYITDYSLENELIEYLKTIPSSEKYLENINGIKSLLKLENKIIKVVKQVIEESKLKNLMTEGVWKNIMDGVRKSEGGAPFSVVAIDKITKKVVDQEHSIRIPDLIPAIYEDFKRKYPNSFFTIEDKWGQVVWNG